MIDWVGRYLTDTVFEKHIISGSWPIRVRFKQKRKKDFPILREILAKETCLKIRKPVGPKDERI